jgi:GT2 family glycosyltransferase
MSPKVSVVIVNHNAGDALPRCLSALRRQTLRHEVLVVDNASCDSSSREAFESFPETTFLPLRHNVGFSRAVNLGARRLTADGVMVTLNPDTIPDDHFLESLVDPLLTNPEVAATAGTLVFTSAPDVIASAGVCVHRNGVALDYRLGERLDRDSPAEPVFGVSGGAAAYRTSAFRTVGGFAEPFFLYLEDVDLSWRMRLQGWNAVSVPSAVARHDYSATSGEGSDLKRRLLARNRIWTLARCLPELIWARDRRQILAFDVLAMLHGLMRLDGATIRGRIEGIAALPARLCERRPIQQAAVVEPEELSRWIMPPVAPRELLRLRKLTGQLAMPRG